MFVLTLTDDKLLKFVLIWGKSCVAFVWGEKLGWPRTLFIILLMNPHKEKRNPFTLVGSELRISIKWSHDFVIEIILCQQDLFITKPDLFLYFRPDQ